MTETFSLSCAISDRVGEWEDCQFFHTNESYSMFRNIASYTQILKRISEGYWFMSRYIGHRYIWEGNWFWIDILEVWHCWTWDQLRSLAQARSCYCSTCQSLSSAMGFRPRYLFEVVFIPRTIVVVILMRASDTLPSRTDEPRGRNESWLKTIVMRIRTWSELTKLACGKTFDEIRSEVHEINGTSKKFVSTTIKLYF